MRSFAGIVSVSGSSGDPDRARPGHVFRFAPNCNACAERFVRSIKEDA
jgi:hypothetical protein